MNTAICIGNIVREPEYRATKEGKPVCSFTIAVQRRYKNKNGEYDADFIGVVTWGKAAEFVHKHFVKGQAIGITGSLQTRNYTDKNDIKRYVTEIIADEIDFIGKKEKSEAPEDADAVLEELFGTELTDADLPF